MLGEVLEYLSLQPGGRHLECGVATGGHLVAICRRLGASGFAVGIDLDEDALSIARQRIEDASTGCKVELRCGDYAEMESILTPLGVEHGSFETALLDAGMSGFQLALDRGFSYSIDSRLDMRYGKNRKVDAEYIVNQSDAAELTRIFAEFGDLGEAARIADAIVDARNRAPICTTTELVNAISEIYPARMPHGKRMRKLGQVFMALREAVNDGLRGLRLGVTNTISYLKNDGGRFAILTFAGHENVIVRGVARGYRKPGVENPDWILRRLTQGALKPTRAEVASNPAAHSAMLRVFEKRLVCGKEAK